MKTERLAIPEVVLVHPEVFGDSRGFFVETFHQPRYADAGITLPFVQDNMSRSTRGVLRGLHLQHPRGQGKLVSVVSGEIFDVAVDVRVGSETFGRWVGATLDETTRAQLWVPPGFAHGFLVLSETATVTYKCTDLYSPQHELSVRWDDTAIGIEWPLGDITPVLSQKDAAGRRLSEIPHSELPTR